MSNAHLFARLTAIRQSLSAVHAAGNTMSSSTRGTEREQFVGQFLNAVLPPSYRFGTGDITDSEGRRSGQADVVIEYSFVPSLPTSERSPRLYLAEGVAAVIEVKSDLSKQWNELRSTANQLAPLKRRFQGMMWAGGLAAGLAHPEEKIPLFAVGYTGWSKIDNIKSHLAEGLVDGILLIEQGVFLSSPRFRGLEAMQGWSLWGLITCLHQAAVTLTGGGIDLLAYAQ